MPNPRRCPWSDTDELMRAYHDTEWGVPEHNSRALFAKLMLDGFQAGLSWSIILKKRQAFLDAFDNFDPVKIAQYNEADIKKLLANSSIVRSRAKIESTITGARAYLKMQDAGEDFSAFLWSFTGNKPLQNTGLNIPAQTPLSQTISKALKSRGFKFVGPVIVYAFMQATGIVNDHHPDCFRKKPRKRK